MLVDAVYTYLVWSIANLPQKKAYPVFCLTGNKADTISVINTVINNERGEIQFTVEIV